MRVVAAWALVVASLAFSDDRARVADRAAALTRETSWTRIAAVPVAFPTHHPQGMVKIGETLFVSSVEIRTRTRRYERPIEGHDRDAGAGVGHLFKLNLSGQLIADLTLGEGSIYHPGGIDFDGRDIWVPVAEYRPDSRSIVYRVDPATMKAAEMLRVADHIGAVVRDTDDNALHGVSWGSRRFYRWTLDRTGAPAAPPGAQEPVRTINPSHYIDYQDCKYGGRYRMICTGVAELRPSPDAPATAAFRLGGIDVVDLRDGRPISQVPVALWTAGGLDMTHNPVWLEAAGGGLRAYFMPEDDRSTIYVYEVDTR